MSDWVSAYAEYAAEGAAVERSSSLAAAAQSPTLGATDDRLLGVMWPDESIPAYIDRVRSRARDPERVLAGLADIAFETLCEAVCGPRRQPGWRKVRPPTYGVELYWGRRKRAYPRAFVAAFDLEFMPSGWTPEAGRDRLLSDWREDESAVDYAKRIVLGHHRGELVRRQLRPRSYGWDEAAAAIERRRAREARLDLEAAYPVRWTSNGRLFR